MFTYATVTIPGTAPIRFDLAGTGPLTIALPSGSGKTTAIEGLARILTGEPGPDVEAATAKGVYRVGPKLRTITRGEALARWMDEHGKAAIDKGITQRYGADILDDGNDEDPTPQFYGVVETPGEVTDEQAVDTLDASIVRYVNEMDPGTFGSEYPVWEWLSDAANTHGHPFGPDHAPAP